MRPRKCSALARFAAGLVLVAIFGCGGDEPSAGGAPGATPPSGDEGSQGAGGGDSASGAETARRVFRDNRALTHLGPLYEAARARLAPEKAGRGWWTEIVAEVAERVVDEGVEHFLSQGSAEAIQGALAPTFRGASRLRPPEEAFETLRDDAVGTARAWKSGPLESGAAADLPRLLAEWLDPLRGGEDARARVQVVGVVPLPARRFETEAWIRVGSRRAGVSVQHDVRWKIVWWVPPKGKRLLIDGIELASFAETRLASPLFAELTRSVLPADSTFTAELMLGSPEYERRVDTLGDFTMVHLGMHGMAVGDIDGDGIDDLYVGTQAGRPNALLIQQADGTVRDVARRAGVDFLEDTSGVVIVDMDGDGARDMVLGLGSGVLVAYNDGDLSFERRQYVACQGTEQVYSVCVADADGDLDLDLYATRYFKGGVMGGVPTPYWDAHNGAGNAYFRNDAGTFVDATAEVGLDQGNDRFSLAALWEDVDRDGDLDLYVTNDFGRNNLYRNDGGRFTDVAEAAGAQDVAASMGITCADVELDGDLDLYVSNMYSAPGLRIASQPQFMPGVPLDVRAGYVRHARGNTLLLARGDGSFEDASERAGVNPGGWAWGAMFADFDNDGLPDLFVPDGFVTTRDERDLESFFWRCVVGASPLAPPATEDYREAWQAITMLAQEEGYSWNGHEHKYAYLNVGGARYADISQASGLDYGDDGRAVCVSDWDGDGKLDLWLRNRTAPVVRFLHGRSSQPWSWIAFDLRGGAPNRDAIGALVEVEAGGTTRVRRLYAGEGYLSSSSPRLHFGLGASEEVRAATVRWPDGEVTRYEGLRPRAVWILEQGAAAVARPARAPAGLATRAAERVPETMGERVTRVPLFDKLPLSTLELPRWQDEAARVGDFAGRPLLLCLWASWNESSVRAFERLLAEKEQLDTARIALWPMALDEAREQGSARAAIEALLPTGERGGRADDATRTLIEILLVECIGNFDDLPLPVALLFDGGGELSAVYVGRVDAREVLADAEVVEATRAAPDGRWPAALAGGTWAVRRPSRGLEFLQKIFAKGGYSELARELAKEIEERR